MKLIWIFIGVGGLIGSFAPMVFGADYNSGWSILTTAIGSIIGVWYYRRLDLE